MIQVRTGIIARSATEHDGLAEPPLRERLCAFDAEFRQRIEALAAQPVLADLALSFPGLLFALASGYATRERRNETIGLLLDGAPLKPATQALGLPMWLRRLPAEAFSAPLDGAPEWLDLDLHVANLVPAEAQAARTWLSAVMTASQGCDESFALWTAGWAGRHSRAVATPQGMAALRWLAAWAWHSGERQTAGYRLLRRPWSATMGHRRALDEMSAWRQRVTLAILLEAGRNMPRPATGEALGLEFVALESAEDYIIEADLMDNCLDQFADRLLQSYSRVFAVRHNGRSVGSLEIGLHEQEPSMPAIRQLRGPRNRRAAPAIWQAAYAWLGSQALPPVSPERWRPSASRVRTASRRIWDPYLTALDARGADDRFRAMVLGTPSGKAAEGARPSRVDRLAAARTAVTGNC